MSDTRNTEIRYLYRDGSNYKVDHTVVFAGAITLAARDRLLGGLLPPDDPDEWGDLIPGQVGLPDLQSTFYHESRKTPYFSAGMDSDNRSDGALRLDRPPFSA